MSRHATVGEGPTRSIVTDDPFADIDLSPRKGGAKPRKAAKTATPPPVPDGVPSSLHDSWQHDATQGKVLAEQCRQLQVAIRKSTLKLLDGQSKRNMIESLNTFSRHFKRVCTPHAVCEACGGVGCAACGGVGYVGVER